MPILYGGLPDETAPPPLPDARWIGNLALDQQPIAWVDQIIIPSTRDVQRASLVNRRRVTRIKEDAVPLVLEVRGIWLDDSTLHFADFSSAMLNQQQVAFNLGDGTEYRMVDVLDVAGTRLMESERDRPGMEGSPWGYVAKVLSYEPYTRDRTPVLGGPVACPTNPGSHATGFNVPYIGTAPGEPTWQLTMVVPSGKHITMVALHNATTGETCTVTGSWTNGTFFLLIDASGGSAGRTPDNNGYGLLWATSPGYGASSDGADVDFSGNPPTLREKQGQIGPAVVYNAITVTITADDVMPTPPSLRWLAPTRNIRVA